MLRPIGSAILMIVCVGCGASRTQPAGTVFSKNESPKKGSLQIRLADENPGEGKTETNVPPRPEKLYMYPTIEFTPEDFSSSRVFQEDNEWLVEGNLASDSAKKMAELTKQNVGKYLIILLDEKPIMAMKIKTSAGGGRFVITGTKFEKEATKIAKALVGQ
jgi:preprotein translocase subunit SecD